MLFGTETITHITDENGSKVVKEVSYFRSKPNLPIRITVSPRVKVMNQKQEHEEYAKFSDEIAKDTKKLDPCFKIEHTSLGDKNGYYYVVPSYTILQYEP